MRPDDNFLPTMTKSRTSDFAKTLGWIAWAVCLGFWVMCVCAMFSCLFDPKDGVDIALVGLFTTVLPLGWALYWTARKLLGVKRPARKRRVRVQQPDEAWMLAARAEHEHELYMQGDPRGVYGQYKPVDLGVVPVVTDEHGFHCNCDWCSKFQQRRRS